MRNTSLCAARAIRMYVPMRAAAATFGPACTATTGTAAAPEASISDEVRTARQLTEAILRSRATRGGATATTADVKGQVALRLALSFGKSALLTHLAHQHDRSSPQRPYHYSPVDWYRPNAQGPKAVETEAEPAASSRPSTSAASSNAEKDVAALSTETEEAWARLDEDKKICWITSTPQGRRALRQATTMADAAAAAVRPGHRSSNPKLRVPTMDEMLSKYPDALVRPRLPRPAALCPAPRTHVLRELFSEAVRGSEGALDMEAARLKSFIEPLQNNTVANHPNRVRIRHWEDVTRETHRETLWFESLAGCLGRDSAVKFVREVKSRQLPPEHASNDELLSSTEVVYDDSIADASFLSASREEALAGHQREKETVYSAGFLDLCEELGIRSARRVYVRSRVLQALDKADAAAQPWTLDHVRELTTKYNAAYNAEIEAVAAAARTSGSVSPEQAVRNFETSQLKLAMDKVQVQLLKFHDDLPLLRRSTSVFDK